MMWLLVCDEEVYASSASLPEMDLWYTYAQYISFAFLVPIGHFVSIHSVQESHDTLSLWNLDPFD